MQKDYAAIYYSTERGLPPHKLKKDGISNLVSRLHREASDLMINRNKKKEEKVKTEDKALHDVDMVTTATKVIILEKFIKDFEISLNNFFFQKKDYMLSFEEFANLFYAFGFIKIPYDAKILEEDEKKDKKPVKVSANDVVQETHEERVYRFKRKTEAAMLKDAWKLLTNGKPESERVDSNQVLVFCASFMGLYNGEKQTNEEDMKNSESQPTKPFILNTEGSALNVNTEENIVTTKASNPKRDKSPVYQPRPKGYYKSPRNSKKIVYAFGSSSNASLKTKKRNMQAGSLNKLTLSTSSSQTWLRKQQKGKDRRVLLKMLIPDLDLNKYSYHSKTVKQINSIFHQLYVNRVEFLVECKRKSEEENKRSASANSAISLSRSGITLGNKSTRSAIKWRAKVLDVIIYNLKSNNIIIRLLKMNLLLIIEEIIYVR